jgi:hypothetical protein
VPANTIIQVRRDTAANWVTAQTAAGATPVLAAGEIGFETDTGKFKVGNGSTLWGSLSYFQVDGSATSSTGKLDVTNSSGDEGGEIFLNKAATNTTITGGVTIDVWQNRLRFFEQGGNARGYYIDITTGGNGVGTNLVGGGGSFTGGTLTSDLVLAAGSGTVEPLTFQTNSATPTATSGAMDYDGIVFYQTANTGAGRALATQNYRYASSAEYYVDFSGSGAVQSMLGATTRGITVAAGTTYEYELSMALQHQYQVNASITGTFQMISTTVSGSPVTAYVSYVDYGSNTTGFTTATTMSSVRATGNVTFMSAISSGSRYGILKVKGIVRVTGSGTVKIYPGLSASGTNDNSWIIQPGLLFTMTPIGNGTVTSVGAWA